MYSAKIVESLTKEGKFDVEIVDQTGYVYNNYGPYDLEYAKFMASQPIKVHYIPTPILITRRPDDPPF